MTCEDCENSVNVTFVVESGVNIPRHGKCLLDGMDESLGRRGYHSLTDKAKHCGNFAPEAPKCAPSC